MSIAGSECSIAKRKASLDSFVNTVIFFYGTAEEVGSLPNPYEKEV